MRKTRFSQNPLNSRFWAHGFLIYTLSFANFKKIHRDTFFFSHSMFLTLVYIICISCNTCITWTTCITCMTCIACITSNIQISGPWWKRSLVQEEEYRRVLLSGIPMFEIIWPCNIQYKFKLYSKERTLAKKKNVAFKIVSKSEVFLVRYPPLREWKDQVIPSHTWRSLGWACPNLEYEEQLNVQV